MSSNWSTRCRLTLGGPKQERRSATALLEQLKAVSYIRAWRAIHGCAAVGGAYVPLSEAFLFDWSGEPLVIGGVYPFLQRPRSTRSAFRKFIGATSRSFRDSIKSFGTLF